MYNSLILDRIIVRKKVNMFTYVWSDKHINFQSFTLPNINYQTYLSRSNAVIYYGLYSPEHNTYTKSIK